MFELTEVLDRAYNSVKAKDMASQKTYLNKEEEANLEQGLAWCSSIFNGELGCHPHKKVTLNIPPYTQAIQKRPYSIIPY